MFNTVAISQPTYLSWLGYFEQISRADCFVFLDNVQFERASWQSRNRIKSADGNFFWLSVPVKKQPRETLVKDIEVSLSQPDWFKSHLVSIQKSLAKTDYVNDVIALLEPIYQEQYQYLADLNIDIIQQVSKKLGLKTQFLRASDLEVTGKKDELLLNILQTLGAQRYLANAGSFCYLDECQQRFLDKGIHIQYQQWQSPRYTQKYGDFIENLAWVDAVAYLGFDTHKLMIDTVSGF